MNLCVDTGFNFALYERKEIVRHNIASHIFVNFVDPEKSINRLVFLWPVLYETLSTRFVRKSLSEFHRDLVVLNRKGRLAYLDDKPYRDKCLKETVEECEEPRCLSLVDRVIREVLFDINLKVDCLLTFNPGDFVDVCRRRKVRLLCQEIFK